MKKRYRVHIYAVVRVPVEVEAESPKEATLKADDSVSLYELFDRDGCEYSDEITEYLVDQLDENGEFIGDEFTTVFKPEQLFK